MAVAARWLGRILLIAAALVAGCGNEAVNRQTIVGIWLEESGLLTARPGSAALATTGAVRRQLAFERDRTFRLTVCDPDRRPVTPPEFVTGTWRISGGAVVLTVKETRLGPQHAGWVPATFLQTQRGSGSAADTLDFRGRDGLRVRYRRVSPAPP